MKALTIRDTENRAQSSLYKTNRSFIKILFWLDIRFLKINFIIK